MTRSIKKDNITLKLYLTAFVASLQNVGFDPREVREALLESLGIKDVAEVKEGETTYFNPATNQASQNQLAAILFRRELGRVLESLTKYEVHAVFRTRPAEHGGEEYLSYFSSDSVELEKDERRVEGYFVPKSEL